MALIQSCVEYDTDTGVVTAVMGAGIVDANGNYFSNGILDSGSNWNQFGVLDNGSAFNAVGIIDSVGNFSSSGILDTHNAYALGSGIFDGNNSHSNGILDSGGGYNYRGVLDDNGDYHASGLMDIYGQYNAFGIVVVDGSSHSTGILDTGGNWTQTGIFDVNGDAYDYGILDSGGTYNYYGIYDGITFYGTTGILDDNAVFHGDGVYDPRIGAPNYLDLDTVLTEFPYYPDFASVVSGVTYGPITGTEYMGTFVGIVDLGGSVYSSGILDSSSTYYVDGVWTGSGYFDTTTFYNNAQTDFIIANTYSVVQDVGGSLPLAYVLTDWGCAVGSGSLNASNLNSALIGVGHAANPDLTADQVLNGSVIGDITGTFDPIANIGADNILVSAGGNYQEIQTAQATVNAAYGAGGIYSGEIQMNEILTSAPNGGGTTGGTFVKSGFVFHRSK
jgi:hypothetical protein